MVARTFLRLVRDGVLADELDRDGADRDCAAAQRPLGTAATRRQRFRRNGGRAEAYMFWQKRQRKRTGWH